MNGVGWYVKGAWITALRHRRSAARDAPLCFGGVPRVVLYDNLKSAVLERVGDAIRFHPTLLELSAHYRFEPRPVARARGNEKGRVERAIRYIRDNFFAARAYVDLDDLNAQALAWATGLAADRRWAEDTSRRVRDAFEEEKPRLLELPAEPFPTDERVEVEIGKTPYAGIGGCGGSCAGSSERTSVLTMTTPNRSAAWAFSCAALLASATACASVIRTGHPAHPGRRDRGCRGGHLPIPPGASAGKRRTPPPGQRAAPPQAP